jgi:hypothetical protein
MATSNIKHTWTLSIKNDSGSAVVADPPLVIVGDAESNFSLLVDPSTTGEVDVVIPVDKMVSGFISADQPVTVNTNAADATGGQSIPLAGGRTLAWNDTTGTNPFTPTITKVFVINAGTKVATVRGGFLLQE